MSGTSKSSLRSPLGRVRGLGSAHHGARHWWMERMTSLALIPLTVWFVVSLVTHLLGAEREGVAAWLASPFVALALATLSAVAFVHTRLGIQVIIEDYIHTERTKIALLLFKDIVIYIALALTLAAIARLHFIGI